MAFVKDACMLVRFIAGRHSEIRMIRTYGRERQANKVPILQNVLVFSILCGRL